MKNGKKVSHLPDGFVRMDSGTWVAALAKKEKLLRATQERNMCRAMNAYVLKRQRRRTGRRRRRPEHATGSTGLYMVPIVVVALLV